MRRKNSKRLSLHLKLMLFSFGILIPFSLLILYLIYALSAYSRDYNQIVSNITAASAYNINLKDDIDYALYKMVSASITAEEFGEKFGEEYQNPYDEIDQARAAFSRLAEITTAPGNARRIRMIQKNLNTLERRMKEIEEDCQKSGHYDENMIRLDNNIYVLTELLQENIQQYIYYETRGLEHIRIELEKQRQYVVQVSVIAFACVFVSCGFLSTMLSRSISRPIEEMCRMTELVAKGNFDARIDAESGDEISVLKASFNSMVGQIGNLVQNIKTEQRNLRDTELRLLQEQINPHFLYNTLDTIIWLAEAGQNKQVVDMVTSLSQFFRTTLSEGRDHITIREEEVHIRSYLEIQQFRYRDILDYEIAIPEQLYPYSIMKLTLQPLVENALYHGVKNKRGKGRIRICGVLEGENIRLTVEDNGIGMKPEEVEALEKRIRTSAEERTGSFGLANVQERICLNYGEQYGLSFQSKYGKGTIVTVQIPAVERK